MEVSDLKDVKEVLEKQVEGLKIVESNTQAQIHQSTIAHEQNMKREREAIRKKETETEHSVQSKLSQIKSRENALEDKEELFRSRIQGIEKREQELLMIDDKRKLIQIERSNFNKYKFDTERELDKAKELIEESKCLGEKHKSKEDELKTREMRVAEIEREWNDRIGKLEIDEKKFEIYKQNVIKEEKCEV